MHKIRETFILSKLLGGVEIVLDPVEKKCSRSDMYKDYSKNHEEECSPPRLATEQWIA